MTNTTHCLGHKVQKMGSFREELNSFFDELTVNFLLNSLLVKKEAYSNREPKDDIAWQHFKP